MTKTYKIGVDIGSTTVKVIIMDKLNNILYKAYKRHLSDIKNTIIDLLSTGLNNFNEGRFSLIFTGSGAMSLSNYLNVPFLQEVIACKNAVTEYYDNVDVAIELGGEDAKIIYFGNSMEERMNGSCAGGTGAFLDQMAILLNTTTSGLNDLAQNGDTIYPIASRCGVFAKTDIQPLLNEGVKKEDIALSIMQAVVNQTISGLACGKPMKGNVIFLGGPLNYLSVLKTRFIKTLDLKNEEVIAPENANLFVCLGAALEDTEKFYTLKDIKKMLITLKDFKEDNTLTLKPLFKNEKEYQAFITRHNKYKVKRKELSQYKGDAFIGIDAGSTTAKLVLIDNEGSLLYESYQNNEGNPIDTIKAMLCKLYEHLPKDVIIRASGSTGYGEALIKTAFNLDISEVETIAHYTSASYFLNGVESIIDIGGQDMKYIKIKDDAIDTIMLNEACSSGCGSFIETLVKSLEIKIEDFVKLAIFAKQPVDLGSRCTIFMNSKIKQTQKEGKPLGDIFAGLSYSIIKNAIYKVMKLRDTSLLGDKIVVQGGTFLNDAILRAFEILTQKEVIRPDIAGLMGAYGVALIALDNYQKYEDKNVKSSILNIEEIHNLVIKTRHSRCQGCENHCALTINTFNKKTFISGNRCEKGSGNNGSNNTLPNMYAWKYERLFSYEPLKEAKRGEMGIPRVLNMYENYPLWFTIFTNLGFKVVLSDHSTRTLYESGIESMPSESVCYPAKLVHGHIMNLINKGVKTIFYPCLMYEKDTFASSDNHYNCPIVQSYSEAIKLNVEDLHQKRIKYINSFLPIDEKGLIKKFMTLDEFKEYHFTFKEVERAIKKGFQELNNFKEEVRKKGEEFLTYINNHDEKAIVLAGRPYHLDKEVNHGIDKLINSLGLAVLTEDSICHLSKINSKLRVVDQWSYHSRIYNAADVVCQFPNLELVELNSFGCGLDAIVTDQTEEILRSNNRLYTTIKIDEINNLGAIKIRLRSLIASMNRRLKESNYQPYTYTKNYFKKKDLKNTILFPDMSPNHMPIFESLLKSEGYKAVYLKNTSDQTVDIGLKYVNNDACYPAIIVVGQLIEALKSGKYDLNKTSVMITQTGGGCRATNYIGLIRKALKDAGLANISIISLNVSGLEKEQAFNIGLSFLNKIVEAILYGDLLAKLLYATRPYEIKKDSSINTYNKWLKIVCTSIQNGKITEYNKNIKGIINDFNNIEVHKDARPVVGIVGEILVKYHAFANDNLIQKLEQEGAEVTVPGLMNFVKYCCYNGIAKEKIIKQNKINSTKYKLCLDVISKYELPIKNALKKTQYKPLTNIYDLVGNVKNIIQTGNQTGEGWLLTAEMVELLKNGVNNILCIQPFACLPNHIVGKSVIKKIRSLYPQANIVAIDYDPGASHTNQLNRIKLMLTIAKENAKIK